MQKSLFFENHAMQHHTYSKFTHEACICARYYGESLIYASFTGWVFISICKFNIKFKNNREQQMFAPFWTNLLLFIFARFLSFFVTEPHGPVIIRSCHDALQTCVKNHHSVMKRRYILGQGLYIVRLFLSMMLNQN